MRKNQLYNVVRVYCLRNKGKHPVPKGYVVTDNIHNTCVCVPVCVRVHQRLFTCGYLSLNTPTCVNGIRLSKDLL